MSPDSYLQYAALFVSYFVKVAVAYLLCWLLARLVTSPRQRFTLWLAFMLGSLGYWIYTLTSTLAYRRLNHDTLEQQIIIEDPRVYTKPWVSPPKLHKLEPGWELAEWFCVLDENNSYDQVVRKPAGVAPSPNK